MDIQIVETDAQMKEMLDEFMEGKKPLTRKDAIEYSKKLAKAKLTKDFKGMIETWRSLGYKRFKPQDYAAIVKPLIRQDIFVVKGILERAKQVKTLHELRKLSLPAPVVPPAYYIYKTGIRAIAEEILTKKSKLHKAGTVITNKVEVSK